MRSTRIHIGVASVAVGVLALALAGLASGGSSAGPVGSGKKSATTSVCGLGTGKKATGAPIKMGGLDMVIPGVDFSTIGKVVAAYFKCVNDNGGINGRPIKYTLYTDALNPAVEAAFARKLIESDKVVGIVGNTSFAECGVNWKYYKSKGFIVIGAGVQAECFGTPSFAESNMGPRYSVQGAAQALVRAGVKSIVISSPDTIAAYADGAALKVAKAAGIPGKSIPLHLPITDANSAILQLVQAAGDGGGVILDYDPTSAPPLMQAAEAQGLVDKVKWGSSTPIANTFMSSQFSPKWDGHLWINQEFSNLDASVGPDTRLMLAILKKYAPTIPPQAFGQMGFMDGFFATTALLNVKGAVTAKSYNAEVAKLKNIKTDMLCKPWYVGKLPYHIPNNWDITVDYKNLKVVVKEKCFAISPVDKSMAQTRVWEKKLKLNTG